MPIVVEVPNRGSIEFADGTSDADIDAIVAKEFPPTQEDSYQKVLGYEQALSDETPTKDEYLAYLQAKKEKPLLGERPMATLGEAALEIGKMLATLPYKAGEAIGDVIMPQLTQEGLTPVDVAVATGAEVAARSELGARRLSGGLQETLLNEIDSLAERFGQTIRSDDDKYQAFLGLADVKRKLAKAQTGQQPAAQEFLQAYNIPQEALSPAGLEVGGFLAAPENIAFAGGGALASQALRGAARGIPSLAQRVQQAGAGIGNVARIPEVQAGRAATAITGSQAAGQAVERAIGTGTTGVAAAEALGLPVAGNIPIPGAGMAASAIGTAKAVGAGLETIGEAGAISGGQALSPIQRGLLGFGERIAAQENASRTARAFGNIVARTGADVIIPKTASILVPALGAGAAGGLLAGLTGEEGDQIAAGIGSGFAFGGLEAGIRMAAAKGVFDANRVRATATEDLNTRPNDVQFTYIDPVTKAEQTVTLKDRDARAQLYEQLDDKQLVKALSEIANAENAGVEVVFHKDGDPVPQDLQQVRYKGVALSTDSVKSGKPTILVNVDKAVPETIPHEILHARITSDMVARIGSQIIEGNIDKAQFKSFANKYAKAMLQSGAPAKAKAIFNQVKDAFDPKLQRAQRIDALRYMADEFAAYYTQEFLAGKDPKTVLPGRLPSFFEVAFNNAKEAVSEKFTRRALQSGFDPIAKTFYGPDGKRIKIPWMEDAVKQLIIERKGFEPSEQKLDIRKLTPNQQAAVIMSRGFEDLYILNPDGSIGRPKSAQELIAQDADIAQRSIKLLDSLPAADRGTVTGLDSKGNTVIQGRLSLAEADALARSGIYSASTSRYITEIARAIQDGSLLSGSYWKVYGPRGRAGVFGEAQKLFLPYGISLNSAGGVLVKLVDFGRVQARLDAALQKQAYRNLFRSYDQALATLRDVYLKNLADPNAKPSAEALGGGVEGARKRNFFNEVMGAVPKKGDVLINEPTAGYTASRKGGSVYEDYRIERIQNIEQTGMKVPWSGDMGEQSSYRRTQLNFQPAEQLGDASVKTDANAGFRIMSKRGKFRVYSPDGDLLGIFDTEGQAKLKAEKSYAAQTRLQPEIDQQQRPARNEVRQTPEAGGRNRPVSRTQGSQEGGEVNQQVRQAGDVGRFMPDQQGFYSKLEDVVANKLPKSATPQQILATVDPAKGSGVKAEELKWTGFAQAVERIAKENGGKVPKEKLMEHLQNEGRVRFEEVTSGIQGKSITQAEVDRLERRAQRTQSNADWRAYEDAVLRFENQELGTEAQYSKYQLPGGENYREIVLTSDTAAPYTSSHFKDIPNYVAHMRVNERAGPDGRPGLFIEEIQSDRHQQAREKGYAENLSTDDLQVLEIAKQNNERAFEELKLALKQDASEEVVFKLEAQRNEARNFLNEIEAKIKAKQSGTPDAPFRKDWSLQMFKRGLRDAVASGKEWIGWTTGETQAERYDLSKQISRIDAFENKTSVYDDTPDGTWSIVAYDNGKKRVLNEGSVLPEELPDMVGKDLADKILNSGGGTFSGLDLKVGGEGMEGFYDKILPAEVQKYVKQWGGEVKKSNIPEAPIWRVDITPQMRESVQKTGQARFMPSDADYLAAVQAGDTQAAQQMVDQAAKAAGKSSINIARGSSGFREMAKEIDNLPDDAVISVFTATSPKTAEGFLSEGVISEEKSYNLTGSFEPGRGLDRGLYVSDSPLAVEGYGRVILKIKVPKGRIAPSTEGVRLGYNTTGLALGNSANGAVISGDISPSLISKWEGDRYDRSPIEISYPAITRDDSGNVIPLSQRFQQSSADIRYMPELTPEDAKALERLPAPRRSLQSAYLDGVKTRDQDPQFYDVPDYLGYDMAKTAAFDLGRAGKEPPRWVMAERIGKLPEGGRSTNFAEQRMESGVSVLRIVGEPQADVGTYEMFNPGEKRYVAGYMIGLGSDGEPLLVDAVDLGPVGQQNRYMPQPDPSVPGAYSVTGGFRILPGKTKGRLRVYGPSGALVGIAGSLDEAQRMIRRKTKSN